MPALIGPISAIATLTGRPLRRGGKRPRIAWSRAPVPLRFAHVTRSAVLSRIVREGHHLPPAPSRPCGQPAEIFDIPIWVRYLLVELGAPKVGATGVSLGGSASALLASVEPKLAFAVPSVPVISIADLVLDCKPIGRGVRAALALTGRSSKGARRLLSPSRRLTCKQVVRRERLFITARVGDRLAPPSHSRLIWEHRGRSRLHWFRGSHPAHIDRGQYFRQLRRFFAGIGFACG